MNKFLITLFCCLPITWAHAQEESRIRFVGLEVGADVLIVEVLRYDNIRSEATWYSNSDKNVRGFGSKFYGGLKAEFRSRNNKFGFSGGLRYTKLLTSMTQGNYYGYSSPTGDFFYFMVAQTDNSIEYLKIKEINESSDYLGIPLAVSYAPFGEHLFTIYFKAGLEFNYRLNTTTTVEFVNPEMKEYNNEVVDQLREPGNLNAVFNTATGVRIKAGQKLTFSLEAGPCAFLTENNSRVVNTQGTFGGQINIQLGL